jgi:uncharacterized membrane protein
MVLSLTIAWLGLIVVPAILSAVGLADWAPPIYRFFSRVCHQNPERVLHLLGYPLAVCIRCASIYFGFFIGIVLGGRFEYSGRFTPIVMLILIPMVADVLLDAIGLHDSSFTTRSVTGLMFGGGISILLKPIFDSALATISFKKENTHAKT